MKVHVFERQQFVPRPRPDLFAFFADAGNLERMTPPNLSFRILTPTPIAMRAGTRIDYRLKLFGIPFRWKTLIESFEPDRSFVDVQLAGPYRSWRHTHRFDVQPGGTLMHDRVEYALPLGPVGEVARVAFVAGQVAQIFDYRRATIDRLFGS